MSVEVARLLYDSDRRYFAAGADSLPFAGGVLRWVPGLQHLPAGCIAKLDNASSVDAARAAAASIDAPLLRLYAPEGTGPDLGAHGFLSATEIAYARRPDAPDRNLPITVRAVRTASDWEAKAALAAALDSFPDGKPASARDWTELERRKSEAGYARFYLAESAGQLCAAFALADCRPLLRIKNLAVHPRFRERGIGQALVAFALRHGREAGFDWVGVFGIGSGPGSRLYEKCGFARVGAQTEWTQPALAPAMIATSAVELAAS